MLCPLKLEVVTNTGTIKNITISVPETIKNLPAEAMMQNLSIMRFYIDAGARTVYNAANLVSVTVKE